MPTLGSYLSTIYKHQDNNDNLPVRFEQDPRVRKSLTNVILVYRGSFNPPHRGHLAVLWHAYKQLANELNIMAAIIYVRSDELLKNKYSSLNNRHLIPFVDRVRLWTQDPYFPPWAWVHADSTKGACSILKTKLKKLAKKDGCRIRFADLYGPDCVTPDTDEDTFGEMTIVSDVGREAGYDQQDGLERFARTYFGPWMLDDGHQGNNCIAPTKEAERKKEEEVQRQQEIAAGKRRAQKAVDENYSSIPDMSFNRIFEASDLAIAKVDGLLGLKDHEHSPKESLATQLARLGSSRSVSVCWQKYARPIKSLRFLRSTSEQNAPFRGICSSGIQEVMHELKGWALKEALEAMALSPSLLWDMLLPARLQRNQRNWQKNVEAGHECASQSAMELDLITVRLGHLQPLVCDRGLLTLDDTVLPMRKRKDSLVPELCTPRRRLQTVDDTVLPMGKLEDSLVPRLSGPGKRKRKMQDIDVQRGSQKMRKVCYCFSCLYDEIVDFSLHPRESESFAWEDREEAVEWE
ncbi:MAG: hypothetical protein LQ338_003860 [Usnochroma carphineum]|nr:MAG: hypothetical protein LQ338_003860 [Usnochroma carphineum]